LKSFDRQSSLRKEGRITKKKLAGIIVVCTIAIIAVIVIVIPRLTSMPGPAGTVSGTYVCAQGGTRGEVRFEVGNSLEFKQDGTVYEESGQPDDYPPYVGTWQVEGDEVVMIFEIGGTSYMFRGTIDGSTITLEGDNSVWVKEAS